LRVSEPIDRFFDRLPAHAAMVLRGPVQGTLRIDLDVDHRTEHWLVTMTPGAVAVTRESAEADAVWKCELDLFADLVSGRSQSIAAVLRNEATVSGEVSLFLAFRRFFPEAPGARDPRTVGREALDGECDRP